MPCFRVHVCVCACVCVCRYVYVCVRVLPLQQRLYVWGGGVGGAYSDQCERDLHAAVWCKP